MSCDHLVDLLQAVALLLAVVTSKTVLTDVFMLRLEEACKVYSSVMSKPHCEMQIFVKLLTGRTITLKVTSSDTIAAVWRKIQEKVPPVQLKLLSALVYRGKYLQDPFTLAHYDIGGEATIFLE